MIYFILTGLIGGFFSGFMGIGGGLIMVPFLVFFAKFSQHLAQGTSLAVLTIPVVAIGAFNYYQNGNVDIKAALAIALLFCIGSFKKFLYFILYISFIVSLSINEFL